MLLLVKNKWLFYRVFQPFCTSLTLLLHMYVFLSRHQNMSEYFETKFTQNSNNITNHFFLRYWRCRKYLLLNWAGESPLSYLSKWTANLTYFKYSFKSFTLSTCFLQKLVKQNNYCPVIPINFYNKPTLSDQNQYTELNLHPLNLRS